MGNEAKITINGHLVTDAQATRTAIACGSCLQEMSSNPDALGDDEHGRRMTKLYKMRLGEVMRLISA